jgi:FAD/FMN-containing dehydrogenase
MTNDRVRAMEDYGAGQGDPEVLAARLHGTLVRPGDAAFEAARAVWNGAAGRPALIAYCADAADVRAAIGFAREHALEVAVRSGGHSLAGQSVSEGGLVVDLSRLKGIDIDPARRRARIGPGLTWGEVAHALQPHGLALTAGDTASVGVGGLTLGGGIGWMARRFGLTIDHLRSVDMITADGRLLHADAAEHAALFWGLRGGGGNFGVATAFEFDLHHGGMILGGAVFYAAKDTDTATDILQAYASLATAAPDGLTTQALFVTAPPSPFIPPSSRGTPVIAILLCYSGDLAEGERVVEPLRRLAAPIADMVAPMPCSAIYALTEMAGARGPHLYSRALFLQRLDDDAARAIAAVAARIMSPETRVQVRVLGGALGRVPENAMAFAHRDKGAVAIVDIAGSDSDEDGRSRARTEQFWQALQPHAAGAPVSFLAEDSAERIGEAYPPATYARLATLKHRYDPTNVFHLNQNIAPAPRAT